jgi:hypothetical protein
MAKPLDSRHIQLKNMNACLHESKKNQSAIGAFHMSRILKKIDQFQQELKAQDSGIPMSYSMMQSMGLLKAATFRLPVTTLAMMDELYTFGPWDSKQEMLFDLVDDAIHQFLQSPDTGEKVREKFQKVAQDALNEWRSSRGEDAA